MKQQFTTAVSCHIQDLWRVLHLSAGRCPGDRAHWVCEIINFLACNFAKCWLILKFFHHRTHQRICSKFSLKTPHYQHCDLPLIAIFVSNCRLLWPPCIADIIFLPFFSIFISFFVFPRLISAAADWMSTILRHVVWPWCEFRMQVWNVRANAGPKNRKKSPSGHHCTTLSGYIFATKARIDNRIKTC